MKNTCNNELNSCIPEVMEIAASFKNGGSDYLEGYKGAELAQAMGCTAKVALNKLDPNNEHNVPNLKDAINLTDYFDDNRILIEWAKMRGLMVLPLIKLDSIPEDETVESLLNINVKYGILSDLYRRAREDGIIDEHEMKQIENLSYQLKQAITIFEEILKPQVREIPKDLERA